MFVNLLSLVNRYREVNPDQEARDLTTDSQLLSIFQRLVESLKEQRQFTELYVFGDSLSDVGNAFDATKELLGEGLPPAPPYVQGHFSNGQIWVEYLAQALELTTKRSTNYAIGGANSGSANTLIPDNPLKLPGLQQQIDRFKAEYSKADPNALYIMWAGANDYLSGSETTPVEPIENLTNAVKSLISVGAKIILVFNLPDLGLLPAIRNDSDKSKFLTTLTQQHNSGLDKSLEVLRKTLNDSVSPKVFDVYALFHQAFANPLEFGFTKVDDSALEQYTNLRGYKEKFFFWDEIHPTTTAHQILTQAVLEVLLPSHQAEIPKLVQSI